MASEDTRERVARAIWEHRRATSELVAVWLPWDGITDDSERNDVLAEAEAVLAVVSPSPVDAGQRDEAEQAIEAARKVVAFFDGDPGRWTFAGRVLPDHDDTAPFGEDHGPIAALLSLVDHLNHTAAPVAPVLKRPDGTPQRTVTVKINRKDYSLVTDSTLVDSELRAAADIPDDYDLWMECEGEDEKVVRPIHAPDGKRFYSSPRFINPAAPPVGVDEGGTRVVEVVPAHALREGDEAQGAYAVFARIRKVEKYTGTPDRQVFFDGIGSGFKMLDNEPALRVVAAVPSSAAPGVTEAAREVCDAWAAVRLTSYDGLSRHNRAIAALVAALAVSPAPTEGPDDA